MLRQHLAHTSMKLPEVLDCIIQVAGALDAAHAAGIVHRDIKPENIMLRPDGYVKVLDFGLAKLIEKPADSLPIATDSQMATLVRSDTEPGTLLGTMHYMSPEQARGQDVDARTDIFALGVMLYEMISGQMPFIGETGLDALVAILEKEPLPLAQHVPDIPTELQRITSKALSKDKEQRYQSAKDLLIDLKNLQEELAFASRLERSSPLKARESAVSTTADKSRLRSRLVALLLVVALVIAVAVLFINRRPASIETNTPPRVEIERSLGYSITVQKSRNGSPSQLKLGDPINIQTGDELRLIVSSPQSGYLYVFNEGPAVSGQAQPLNILFPSETANEGSSYVKENQLVQIPEQSSLRFDQQKGAEKIWLVWADKSLPDLEQVKKYANREDKGEIKNPALNANVEAFLKERSSSTSSTNKDRTEAVVKSNADMLVHVISLQHH